MRAPVGRLAVFAVVLVWVAAMPGSATIGADWPQYGRGPAHAGYQPVETLIAPDTAPTLDVRWRHDLAARGRDRYEIYAAPVVADGLVFAAPMRPTFSHGALWALDAQTGERRWKTTDLGTLVAPPAVSDGIVVVNASYPFEAIAFDAATGETLWRQQTVFGSAEGENFQGTAPVIADGIAVVSSAGDTLQGDRLGKLWAFDLGTGHIVWTRPQTWSRPAVDGGTVFVGDDMWAPGGMSRGNHLLAIALEDGTLRWRTTLGGRGATVGAPSIANGVVYVTVQRPHRAELVTISAGDGSLLRSASIDAWPNYLTPPMVAPDRIVIETFTGTLVAFSADLDHLWTARIVRPSPDVWTCTEGACASPSGANGVVFAVAGARMRAFGLEDGRSLWSWRIGRGGSIGNASSPAISNGTVYVGSDAGYLYAFG